MAGWYRMAWPLIRRLEPERAHRLAIRALRAGLVPSSARIPEPRLAQRLWGLDFATPVGMAAGFDKDGEAIEPLFRLGCGFVEVGTVTPQPQPGNPQPRLFRLIEDRAVINRMGFNNRGMVELRNRLMAVRRSGPVGINLGRNRDSTDPIADYVAGVEGLGPLADYIALNVSSPNTPGLRDLQERGALADLLAAVAAARDGLDRKPPLLLKIAPDLSDREKADIAAVVLETGVDGLIATNTTTARPSGLSSPAKREAGGLSGSPLFEASTRVLADMYRLTEGRIPLVGVGGVSCGRDAYAKIRAGASLVQVYTALVFEGPDLIARVNRELAALLAADGIASVAEVVGADV